MKNRHEIEKDVKSLSKTLHEEEYIRLLGKNKAEAMEENINAMFRYVEENDLWNEPCWGTDESVVYVCMYIAMTVNFDTDDRIKTPESFYNFVKEWCAKEADYYRGLESRGKLNGVDSGTAMAKACAAEILEAFKNEEENELIERDPESTHNEE